jgi:hypothetical protein
LNFHPKKDRSKSIPIINMNISDEEKLKHPYYKLMELRGNDLEIELNSWTRLALIEWLCWNDRNGIYKDEQCIFKHNLLTEKYYKLNSLLNLIRSV